jgi:hypothetical protein
MGSGQLDGNVNVDVGLDFGFESTRLNHAIEDVSSSSSEMGVKSSTTLMGRIPRGLSVLNDESEGRTSGRRQGIECFLKPRRASASSLWAQGFCFLRGGCSFMSGSTMTGLVVFFTCCIIGLVVIVIEFYDGCVRARVCVRF